MWLARRKIATLVGLALGVAGTGAAPGIHNAPAQGADKRGPQTVALTEANYKKLRDQVLPTAAQLAWQKVPWRPTVWDGIVEGQASDRPILMWIMNGHPLACT